VEFVLAVGDNFYHHGIDTDENDPRFHQSLKDVYTPLLASKSWYPVLIIMTIKEMLQHR
jgi:hypothetical protein